MVQAHLPGTREVLAGGSEVQGQSRLQGGTLSQKKEKRVKRYFQWYFGCDMESFDHKLTCVHFAPNTPIEGYSYYPA